MDSIRRRLSGSCLLSHLSFGPVKPGIGFTPTIGRQAGMVARQFRGLRDRRVRRCAGSPGEPDLIGAVEEDRAVHLAGKADRLQRAERLAGRS